jgi:O-antigen/teichoic acid export membrane protein
MNQKLLYCIISLLLFPIYMGMIVLAGPLISLLLGERWTPAIPTFQLLCVLGFFYSLGNPIGSLLLAKGRVEIGLYLNIWMIVLYSFAIWVGSSWGVEGVAAGLVIANSLGLFPVGFWVRWLLVGMRPLDYVAAFGPMLVSAAVMGGCVLLGRNLMPSSVGKFAQLATLTLAGCVIYLLIILSWQRPFFARLKQTLH